MSSPCTVERVGILHHGKLEKIGTPAKLKADIGPNATINDVFARITGADKANEGNYRDVRAERRSASE